MCKVKKKSNKKTGERSGVGGGDRMCSNNREGVKFSEKPSGDISKRIRTLFIVK